MQSVAITTDKDNRVNFKNQLLSKVEMALTPPTVEEIEPDTVEVDIIDKYSTWVPARFALESDELPPLDIKKEEAYVPQHELEERATVKRGLLNKVEESLVLVEVEETAPIEIIEKYSNWVPARLSLEPVETLSPEFKTDETVVFPRESEKRASIKQSLLNKVETSLNPAPVPVKPEPAPIEIIEKYSDWVPAGFALEPVDVLPPEGKKDELFIPLREMDKREGIKHNLLNKVEESLTPVEVVEPAPVEIVEKYSNWAPARLSIEPEETLSPEFKTEATVILPLEVEKRVSIKQNLLNKLETSLIPAPVEIEVPIEIIDKYSEWTPAGFALEAAEALLPEGKRDEESFVLTREQEKRADIKHSLSNKVEEALVPPVPAVEPEPIEILDKYSNWAPARLSLEPQEVLSPEFKPTETVVFPREQVKRVEIKHNLSNKVEESLIPPAPTPEPEPIEIIDKYSMGIPQHPMEDSDPVFPDARRVLKPTVLNLDVPKRLAFKETLMKKLNTLPMVEEKLETVEIVGDYSQRTVTPYGLDFEEANRDPLVVSDIQANLQATIADFIPVDEEPVVPVLRIPENYGDLDEQALYGVLIRTSDLRHTSETANLVMDVLAGRSSRQVEFVIVEAPKPVVAPKKVKVKTQAPVTTETLEVIEPKIVASKPKAPELESFAFDIPSDWNSIPLSVLRNDLLSTGATPEQVDAKLASLVQKPARDPKTETTHSINTMRVEIPVDFGSRRESDRYSYLTKVALLSPELAHEAIAAFKSPSQQLGNNIFEFVTSEIVDVGKRNDRRQYLSDKASKQSKIVISEIEGDKTFLLPSNYTDLSETELHFVLSFNPELSHSHESVIEALDILYGRVIQSPTVNFKIVNLPNPVVYGYKEEKVSVIKVESVEKPKAHSVTE